jgi:acetyltransferase-like isoleucine patch superfamily enzyme
MNPYLCIAPGVELAKHVKGPKYVNLYGCEVSDETEIGAFATILAKVTVGERAIVGAGSVSHEERPR